MDADLRKYNTLNANLGFMVDDLRGRQDNMQDSIIQNRFKRIKNEIEIS